MVKKKDSIPVIVGVAIVSAIVGGFISSGTSFGFDQLTKKAKIDYTFENYDNYANFPRPSFSDPNDSRNQFPDKEPIEVLVFLRNRGDIEGGISLTASAVGATISNAKDGVFANTSNISGQVINDNTWVNVRYYIKPEPNAQTITLSLSGQGIGQTEVFGLYKNPITYVKQGIIYQLQK